MEKIILWGVGERTERYIKFGYFDNCELIAFIDLHKHGGIYFGKKIYEPEYILDIIDDIDFLIITTQYFSEIYNKCINMGIPREKIVLTDIVREDIFNQNIEIMKALSPMAYKEMCIRQYKLIKMNEKDYLDDNRLIGKGKYSKQEYMSDYYRYRTFEFIVEEIQTAKIEGCAAEFGVFRGTFSALINEKMPERKLFLFDTFEGFDKKEAKRESELGRSDEIFEYAHQQTSAERALAVMPFPEKCILCKGLFPSSVTKETENEKYAFVSIDVDFEDSIYEGLKFFYPRLSSGGYIFLHDYNSAYLSGVKKAVQKYESEIGTVMRKVPIADRAGTLIIVK